MKAALTGLVLLASIGLGPTAAAQITSPRAFTKRIDNLVQPPPPAWRPSGVVATNAPAAPPDPAKVKAEKDEATKRLVEFQKQRAEAGSPSAQYDLGVRYMLGDGVKKDFGEARKWLLTSRTNGNATATAKLTELDKVEKAETAAGTAKKKAQ